MKKKKVIAWVSSVVVMIGLVVLLAFTFFAVGDIKVDFRTSRLHLTATDEEIVQASGAAKGGTIFFANKEEYAKKIEDEFPYANVINIESVFPSTLVIHVAERQEVYAIKGEDYVYICDEEMRVLRTADTFESTTENAMLLTLDSSLSNLRVGDYITEVKNPRLYQELFDNNFSLAYQKELIKEIKMTKEHDDSLKQDIDVLKLSLYSGQTVTIANFETALSQKAYMFLYVYSNLFEMIGKESLQKDGKTTAPLTAENLKTCEIYVNNYYTSGENLDLNQENCYFKIFVEQSV